MNFEVKYSGGTHTAAAGLNALVIYEQEFESDLIKDVFGIVEVKEEDLEKIAEEKLGGKEKESSDVVLVLDYTQTNWTKIVKAVWACLKNYNGDSIPSFKTWVNQTEGMNLTEVQNAAIVAFNETFFPSRSGDAAKEADGN